MFRHRLVVGDNRSCFWVPVVVGIHDQHCDSFLFAKVNHWQHRTCLKTFVNADRSGPNTRSNLSSSLNQNQSLALRIDLLVGVPEWNWHENVAFRQVRILCLNMLWFRHPNFLEYISLYHSFLDVFNHKLNKRLILALVFCAIIWFGWVIWHPYSAVDLVVWDYHLVSSSRDRFLMLFGCYFSLEYFLSRRLFDCFVRLDFDFFRIIRF